VRYEVTLPKLGDAMQSALVTEWRCAVGDRVEAGAPLVTVETDKVTTEVPSPVAGTVVELAVAPDDEVEVGALLCTIETA